MRLLVSPGELHSIRSKDRRSSGAAGMLQGQHLSDVSGFATHVGPGDDLEPAFAPDEGAVILDEVHFCLSLYAWMPACTASFHVTFSHALSYILSHTHSHE